MDRPTARASVFVTAMLRLTRICIPLHKLKLTEAEAYDSEWYEVRRINNYAVFVGSVSMTVRGLGFLVLTWTTVVLLGGFVSELDVYDFWSLTIMTLVQTAGVFDVIWKEKHRYVGNFGGIRFFGFLHLTMFNSTLDMFRVSGHKITCSPRVLAAFALLTVQIALMLPVMYATTMIYELGMYLYPWIPVWQLTQLRQANYTKANLKPSLYVLYLLAAAQSALFVYLHILYTARKGLAADVTTEYGHVVVVNVGGPSSTSTSSPQEDVAHGLDEEQLQPWIYEYVKKTMEGCQGDLTFAKGRNLVTYAVDLLMTDPAATTTRSLEYTDGFLSGVRILGTILGLDAHLCRRLMLKGQRALAKRLLAGSASFDVVVQRLLATLGPRSPCSGEIREHAARILAHLAGEVRLDRLPAGAVRCVASLLDTYEQYCRRPPAYTRAKLLPKWCERDWLLEAYERDWLLEDHHGSRPNANTHAAFPADDDAPAAPHTDPAAERERRLRRYKELPLHGLVILFKLAANEDNCAEIGNDDTGGLLSKIMAPAVSDVLHRTGHGAWPRRILDQSLRVLLQLAGAPGETGTKLRREIASSSRATGTMERILKCRACGAELQGLAISVLAQLAMDALSSSSMAAKSRENFVTTLIAIFTDDNENISVRELAGQKLAMLISPRRLSTATLILKATDDAVASLTKILLQDRNLRCRTSAAEALEHLCATHYINRDNYFDHLKKSMTDVMPKAALLSLCVKVCDTFIAQDEDLSVHLGAIAPPGHGAFSVVKKLEEMVERNSGELTAHCLRILKLTASMVISMMKRRGSYVKEDLESLMGALSSATASEAMSDIDSSMIFASIDDDGAAMTTLMSLVKEAEGLLEQKQEAGIGD